MGKINDQMLESMAQQGYIPVREACARYGGSPGSWNKYAKDGKIRAVRTPDWTFVDEVQARVLGPQISANFHRVAHMHGDKAAPRVGTVAPARGALERIEDELQELRAQVVRLGDIVVKLGGSR